MAAPTSRDVARVAGVSQSTVSYVMSGKRPISGDVRDRVQSAIEQLTYQPNANARALASSRTSVVGLVVPFSSAANTSHLLPFIETIANGLREHDYDLLLVTADEGDSGLIRLASRRLCDAIVLMGIEARDRRVPVAASLPLPVVLIGIPDDPAGLRCVDVNFETAARLAVEDLVSTGHDRVVVLGHARQVVERGINYVGRFERSALGAALEAGVPCEVISPVEPTRAGAQLAVGRALSGPGARLGLIVAAESSVPLVLQALVERGRTPGRDLSLLAVSTDAAAEAMQPPVSNVSLEPRDVSRRTVQALFQLLGREEVPSHAGVELVTPRLTRRDTTLTWSSDPLNGAAAAGEAVRPITKPAV